MSAISPPPPLTLRLEAIDFAKGFAILTIVVYHFLAELNLPVPFSSLIFFGGTGIHLFFFLSGFGLNLSKYTTASAFYRRRFKKILLPYYLLVLLSFGISLVLPIYQEFGWKELLSHLLLYKMFSESYIGTYGYHLWFISTLIQFYLLFPLLKRLQERLGNNAFLLGALLLSAAYWILVWALGKGPLRVWNSFFLSYLWEFALGMYLAARGPDLRWAQLRLGQYALLAVLGTGLMGAIVVFGGDVGRLFNDIPALAGYGALCLGVYSFSDQFAHWLKKAMLKLGEVSYSFFLVHILVLLIYQQALAALGLSYSLVHVPILLMLTYVAALGFEELSKRILNLA